MAKTFTVEEVALHNTKEDAWFIYKDKVYDFTPFLEEHPGGPEEFNGYFGKDITKPFNNADHTSNAIGFMKKYQVGIVKRAEATPIYEDTLEWIQKDSQSDFLDVN